MSSFEKKIATAIVLLGAEAGVALGLDAMLAMPIIGSVCAIAIICETEKKLDRPYVINVERFTSQGQNYLTADLTIDHIPGRDDTYLLKEVTAKEGDTYLNLEIQDSFAEDLARAINNTPDGKITPGQHLYMPILLHIINEPKTKEQSTLEKLLISPLPLLP